MQPLLHFCDFLLLQVREKADIKYLASAQKMADKYLKKKNVQSFLIGENVSLRIPRIDRASSDLSRLFEVHIEAYLIHCCIAILMFFISAGVNMVF